MAMYFLYWGLLVIWVPLLWPMIRLKGAARVWLLVVIAAGIAALAYEVPMYLWSHASIRLDILLISVVLGCLYGLAVVVLFAKLWRKSAAILAGVLVLIGGGMVSLWVEAGRESQRVGAAFHESNVLLFKAKFRDTGTYKRVFGPFTSASDGHPTGHWQVAGKSHLTRVIINGEGRVWLFYQCQVDAECHFGPGGSGLILIGGSPRQWSASLKPPVGLPVDIRITEVEADKLLLEYRKQDVTFAKAPPPIDPDPAPQRMEFLGPFSKIACSGQHATVHQIWLWRDDARAYAVGIFWSLVAGRYNGYVTPVLLGERIREDAGWRFTWQQEIRTGTALITLNGDHVLLSYDQEGRDREDTDKAVLTPGAVLPDERIELAPLTAGADWHHWFDNMLVGHFVAGNVPDC